MEHTPTLWSRAHPLVLGAAASVIVLSVVGLGAITGLVPTASSQKGEQTAPAKSSATEDKSAGTQSESVRGESRTAPAASCPTCGIVEAIHTVEIRGDATGLGAVAGGVAGGVIGHQFGQGTGNAVATVAGAAGGAYAGNEIEKNVKKRVVYRVTVRMDDGSYRTLSQSTLPSFAIGDKVRLVGGAVVARS